MYIRKQLYQQVMKLFVDCPKYRDDRWATLDYIVNNYYSESFVNYGSTFYKLIFDIDRAFRYIQQHVPELRGETWLKRQVMAGELSKSELSEIQQSCVQLKLNYE